MAKEAADFTWIRQRSDVLEGDKACSLGCVRGWAWARYVRAVRPCLADLPQSNVRCQARLDDGRYRERASSSASSDTSRRPGHRTELRHTRVDFSNARGTPRPSAMRLKRM
ncbi:hypothetical protein GCM10012319_16950 [Comamonas sp. KCTC 72670]|nr:hypothetical protein GCM10012319_16950 [Comamonas sp. KCTC 72670]